MHDVVNTTTPAGATRGVAAGVADGLMRQGRPVALVVGVKGGAVAGGGLHGFGLAGVLLSLRLWQAVRDAMALGRCKSCSWECGPSASENVILRRLMVCVWSL